MRVVLGGVRHRVLIIHCVVLVVLEVDLLCWILLRLADLVVFVVAAGRLVILVAVAVVLLVPLGSWSGSVGSVGPS